MSLATLFPHASADFLKANQALPARLPHAKPQPDARKKSLDSHQDEKGSSGRFEVCITRLGTKPLDPDNLMGGCKAIVDSLRYEGLIPADDPQAIELIVRQRKVKKSEVGTELTIRLLPDTL